MFHEFQNQLMIGLESPPMQLDHDPTVAITAFILDTDLLDLIPFVVVLCTLTEMFEVVVITAPGDFGCYQEPFPWIYLP